MVLFGMFFLCEISIFLMLMQFFSRETQALYDELSMIFSDDLNSKASRDLLMQVSNVCFLNMRFKICHNFT